MDEVRGSNLGEEKKFFLQEFIPRIKTRIMPFFEPFREFGTSKGTPRGRMDVQERSVGGTSSLNGYKKQLSKERWRERLKVVFIMMLVLIVKHVKCVMI